MPPFVTCPQGTSVLSGGGYSNSGSTTVDLTGLTPIRSDEWITTVTNNGSVGSTVTAYAICATV